MPFADPEYLPRRRKPVEAWLDRDEAFRDWPAICVVKFRSVNWKLLVY